MADFDKVLQLVDGDSVRRDVPEDLGLRPLPNRAVVWVDKPETQNGIYLPPDGRMTPDVGVLAHHLETEHYSLAAGTIVAFRPYRGVWFTHESGWEYRIFGVQEPLDYALLMVWDGEWKPLAPWSVIRMAEHESELILIGRHDDRGEIISTTNRDYEPGEMVVCEMGNGMRVPLLGEGCVLTKEIHAGLR